MLKQLIVAATAALAIALTTAALAQTIPEGGSAMPNPESGAHAEVNGVRIWYQTYGTGEPLVVVHGGFGAVEMFTPILPRLIEGRRVIGIDLQAHGRTGPLGRPMTLEAMAADVAGVIRSLGYQKADVLGYSLGGATALRVAIDHPDVVDRLVLISTAWAFSNWHDYNFQGMRSIAGNPEATAEGLKQSPMYELLLQIAPENAERWPDMVREFAGLLQQDYDWSAEVAGVSAPTLVVVGDWDSVRISAATKLFEMLGGGAQDALWDRSGMGRNRFAVLPNTTHYDILTSPTLLDVVLPFLDGYAQPAGRK